MAKCILQVDARRTGNFDRGRKKMKNLWQHLPSIFPGTNSDFFLLQLSVQFAAGIQRKVPDRRSLSMS
ncbi:MAG: hypothetical protein CMN77_10685 [Spirochaetaceae bacterium]|nr:hypothetical protein [Spirochaetaceae bacterium]